MLTIVVIAKECIPGKVKTRLHPPLSYEEAAEVAAASLADTLATVRALPFTRLVLAFDGENVPAEAHGFEVLPQIAGTLDQRLAAIFDTIEGPMVLIGMDTPQVTRASLESVLTGWRPDVDAWMGPAADGGFWALGMRHPDGSLIRGVPMSREDTGKLQLERLHSAGLTVRLLPTINDIDTVDDALEVSELVPSSRFGRAFRAISRRLVAEHASS